VETPSGTLVGDRVDRPRVSVAAPCGWLGIGWVAKKLRFSPDGSMVAIHDGRHVKLLRVNDYRPLHALPPRATGVVDFAFTADDTVAISAALEDADAPPSANGPPNRTRVHAVSDGAILAELSDPEDPAGPEPLPLALAASGDGSVLASAQRNGGANKLTVSIWSMPESVLVKTIEVATAGASVVFASLAVSPDGARVAVSTAGKAHLFDAGDGTELAAIDGVGSWLTFSPDSRYLAGSGAVVDASTGAAVMTTTPDDLELFVRLNEASALAFSADSSLLFIGTRPSPGERTIFARIVEGSPAVPAFEKGLTTPEPSITEQAPMYFGISALAVSPDGSELLSVGSDALFEAWQTSDGRLTRSIAGHVNTVDALAISADRATLASSANRPDTLLWSLSGSDAGTSTAAFPFPARTLALSDDGSRLLQLSDRQLSVVATSDGSTLQTVDATALDEAALSPDGELFARAYRDGKLELVAVSDASVRHELHGLDREARALAFSPSGTQLAAVSVRNVAIWKTTDGSLLHASEIFSERVVAALSGVAFSPDESLLALVGGGIGPNLGEVGLLMMLGAGDGAIQSVKLVPGIKNLISAVFSPDGSRFATFAGLDGGTLWNTATRLPVAEVDSVVPAAVFLSNDELATAEDNGSIARWCLTPD
jgi:WD40 repeat protein